MPAEPAPGPGAIAPPRAVVVTRRTALEHLLERHGTRGQAAFFVRSRGGSLDGIEAADAAEQAVVRDVLRAVPPRWRRVRVDRDELDRFPFAPDDVVLAVGRDGLVANVAKYVADGPAVIGVNADPATVEGVLVRHAAADVPALLAAWATGALPVVALTLAACTLDDGQRLLALNELFVGHRSHQSARYLLEVGARREEQSSSGLVAGTGTGATAWTRSIRRGRPDALPEPAPDAATLALYVREPWPSLATGASLAAAVLGAGGDAPAARVTSRMDEGGVVFADGVERDALELGWGRVATIGPAAERLRLG